ncbi:hypothetical protein FXF50_10035 [Micromonospora sp. AP08]|uniref:hypothetical protein n=1 Tax=Micromonospora sp. AP08 TaxID=2604467 RepID=UPI0011D64915|nr:hypothetical protein [Micromonospora sp. AP08]TYB38736.1 hypothetical protein FXF50_10035 [Micromonospora sp. AP08]
MLPIALTCPVWWVARWIARTLASLAVLAACSFGAATLPVGGAATTPVASSAVAPVEGRTLQPGAAGQHLSDVAPVDHRAVPVGGPEPVAAPRAVTRPAGRPVVLAGLVPATVGSRAPPAR